MDAPSERAIRKAANHYRIARSVFLGRVIGEPSEACPDADPRLWLPEDTQAALEWAEYESSLCVGCGNRLADCMDEANDGAYEAVALHCFACAERDAENRRIGEARSSDEYGGGSFDGLYLTIAERVVTNE